MKVLVLKGATDATNTAGVTAIKALGTANNFGVDEAAGVDGHQRRQARRTTGAGLPQRRRATCSTPAGRRRCSDFVENGNGFLGIGSTAHGRAGLELRQRPDRRAPRPEQPDDERRSDVVPGDRVHPSTRDAAAAVEPHRRLVHVGPARPARSTPSRATTRRTRPPATARAPGGTDTPISWCRDYRGGRSFYTGMGRIDAAYAEADFKQAPARRAAVDRRPHARRLQGDDQRQLQGHQDHQRGPDGTGLATSGESHGLTIASNGWVHLHRPRRLPHRRRARRAARPAAVRPHPRPRRPERRHRLRQRPHLRPVGVQRRREQRRHARRQRSRSTATAARAASAPSEADHKMEYGLLGITAVAGLRDDGPHLPAVLPDLQPAPARRPACRRRPAHLEDVAPAHLALHDRPRRPRSSTSSSEVWIFEYDAQIYCCCHVGGGMGFDSKGNLYVTTGDTNSSQGTNGYSGNNPVAKCPTGDNTVPSSANCGTAGYSYQDARRTAGNTNDYNGKMLRIQADHDAPGRLEAAGRHRHDVHDPGRRRAQRPEPVQGRQRATATRPSPRSTRWACATRAACRSTRRPTCRTRRGSVRTPARRAATRGPVDVRERRADHARRQLRLAVLHGQQAGLPRPHRRRQPAHRQPGRLRARRSRHRRHRGLVRLRQPAQRLAQQHRPDGAPAHTGTGADAGKVRGNNLWYSRGNPNNANGCPEFPRAARRHRGAGLRRHSPTQLCPYAPQRRHDDHERPGLPLRRPRADNSQALARSTGTAAGSCTTTAAPSIKHGLLLDPDTDQDGGLPVYADSLRDTLTWRRLLHGLQVRARRRAVRADLRRLLPRRPGRRHLPLRLHRRRARLRAPTRGRSRSARCKVRFSSAGSGGVSCAWDFGDGSDVDRGQPDAHLRRGQALHGEADGHLRRRQPRTPRRSTSTCSRPRTRRRPITTATLAPATPGAGGTYTRPVTVTLTATDAAGGRGVDTTEYRVNGGEWADYERSDPPRAARHVPDRVPLDGPHRQRGGHQVGRVHDRRGRELPDELQRRVQRDGAGPEVDGAAR